MLHEPFAEAHGLGVGDTIEVLMNGAKRWVRIVGVALSPEYVDAIAPGMLMPDDARYGIIWMGREALAAAFDLDGAFNDVSLALLRGAIYQAPRTSAAPGAQDLSPSSQGAGDRPAQPGLVRRHHPGSGSGAGSTSRSSAGSCIWWRSWTGRRAM